MGSLTLEPWEAFLRIVAVSGSVSRGTGRRFRSTRRRGFRVQERQEWSSWAAAVMAETIADTRRLSSKPQNLNDAYGPPNNFLEIEVGSPQTVGVARGRYTTYEIRLKTNLPIFKLKESCVRRRYSDFEWLRGELERESKVVVPPLPGKAFFRQLPFRGDDGIFDDAFIEERKQGLEQFINKVAGHPLAQNVFLLKVSSICEGGKLGTSSENYYYSIY